MLLPCRAAHPGKCCEWAEGGFYPRLFRIWQIAQAGRARYVTVCCTAAIFARSVTSFVFPVGRPRVSTAPSGPMPNLATKDATYQALSNAPRQVKETIESAASSRAKCVKAHISAMTKLGLGEIDSLIEHVKDIYVALGSPEPVSERLKLEVVISNLTSKIVHRYTVLCLYPYHDLVRVRVRW